MPLSLLATLFVVLGSIAALVSALETALFTLREHHIDLVAGRDEKLGARLRRLFEKKERFINIALFLSALLNLSVAASGLLLHRSLVGYLTLHPLWLAFFLIIGAVILADLVPKLISLGRPRGIFRLTAGPLLFLEPILGPFAGGLAALSERFVRKSEPKPGAMPAPSSGIYAQELETLVRIRRDEGSLEEDEGEMIHEIIKLRSKTTKDCMTPRVDVFLLPDNLPPDEADRAIREQPFDKVPIYHGNPDELTGVLDVSAYLHSESLKKDYLQFVIEPVFVSETMAALDAFERDLAHPDSFAMVLDEFGGLEGVITQTDLVEDIIEDTSPLSENDQEIQQLGANIWLVTGSARLDDLSDDLDFDLEEDGIDTIGGLIFTMLGRIPERGKVIMLTPTLEASIRKSSDKRAEEILIRILPEPVETESKKEGGHS